MCMKLEQKIYVQICALFTLCILLCRKNMHILHSTVNTVPFLTNATLEITGWNQEQSVVEMNSGQDDSDRDEESLQSTIEEQTMYRKVCDR